MKITEKEINAITGEETITERDETAAEKKSVLIMPKKLQPYKPKQKQKQQLAQKSSIALDLQPTKRRSYLDESSTQ
jgi:hypothetical protein